MTINQCNVQSMVTADDRIESDVRRTVELVEPQSLVDRILQSNATSSDKFIELIQFVKSTDSYRFQDIGNAVLFLVSFFDNFFFFWGG